MVAISVSRFPIVMERGAFMHQTAYLAVKFCMNIILHHRILAFAVFAFHLTPSTYAFIFNLFVLCLKREKSPTYRSEKKLERKTIPFNSLHVILN